MKLLMNLRKIDPAIGVEGRSAEDEPKKISKVQEEDKKCMKELLLQNDFFNYKSL